MSDMRWVAAGFACGLLVALSPACGTTEKCTAASCSSGCCSADGRCESGVLSNACGLGGNTCQDCGPSALCAGGACTPLTTGNSDGGSTVVDAGPDGGAGDGGSSCGPFNCNGCCTSGDVCMGGLSHSECGTGGAACSSCPHGCNQGACNPPGSTYGSPCEADPDCAHLGAAGICKLETSSGSHPYEGGYCTELCGPAGVSCGPGSTCIHPTFLGESDQICAMTCTPGDGGECRSPGYFCHQLANGDGGVCYLPPVLIDGGEIDVPPVGSPCEVDSYCEAEGGFPEGLCFEATNGGNPTGWIDGYCSADCTALSSKCGASGICIGIDSLGNARCFDRCPVGGAGQSDCRDDYLCATYTSGGNTSLDGFCFPDCRNPGFDCDPRACNPSTGYCE